MQVTDYSLHNEVLDLKKIKLNVPIVYEIVKKYMVNVRLENM